MKKLSVFLSLLILGASSLYAWPSETGGGVVSANSNVVLTSIEATQVLKSDTLSQLLGETDLGGSVNYASFQTGGVLSFRNQTTSRDTVLANTDQYISWGILNGQNVRLGLSADNTFVNPSGASFNTVQVNSGGLFRVSADTSLTKVSLSTVTISSTFKTSGDVVLAASTVASLPTCAGRANTIRLVTDANAATDCTAGGGSTLNLCACNSSGTWVDM